MPGPFELPTPPDADDLISIMSVGARARQVLAAGVEDDLTKRWMGVLRIARNELKGSVLTPERALMHIACINSLMQYGDDLRTDIAKAQRAADQVHADADESRDGDL